MGTWELVATKPAKPEDKEEAASVNGQPVTMIDLYGFKKITFQAENKATVVSGGQFQIFGEGTEWLPVAQDGSKLTISLLNDQVETMKLVAEFLSDDEVKFGLEFGRGTPTQPLGNFKRVKE
jgi:hypothetical protein